MRILLALIVVFSITLLSLDNIYADVKTENGAYLNLTQEISENNILASTNGTISQINSIDTFSSDDPTTSNDSDYSNNSISSEDSDNSNDSISTNSTAESMVYLAAGGEAKTTSPSYSQATSNCQVTNSKIQALAKSITKGKTSTYDKAVAIFNWVRDNLSYSFYYNTKYGAAGALAKMTGNCCDTAHLLIALERAAGIPARYEHGYCKFSSGNWYGHVWAQVYVDGKWYNADATSYRNTFGVIKNWNTKTAKIYGTYASLPF